MTYINMELNQQNSIKKKIILFGLILSIILSSIIYLYISNHSANSNTRRKINEIQQDITHLYNYTETMSDFIVDNYKVPEITLDLDLKKFINISLKTHIELKEFKKESSKTHMELNDFKNKSLKTHMELKMELNEMNKNFIRKTAVEYLNKYYGLFKPDFQYYQTPACINKLLNIDYFKLFEELLNIDYENKIVSFAYFTEDTIENFKSHPFYKIINNSLEYDYEMLNSSLEYEQNIYYIYNNYEYNIVFYKPNFIGQIPFKKICNVKSYYQFSGRYHDYIGKIYNEYEYISRMISFVTIRPQKFM